MAVNDTISNSSLNLSTNSDDLQTFHVPNVLNKYKENLSNDSGKVKWLGTLEDLKKFVSDMFDGDGKWRSPGGKAKSFRNDHIAITWYSDKKTLLFQGRIGNRLKERILNLPASGIVTSGEDNALEDNASADSSTPTVNLSMQLQDDAEGECSGCKRVSAELAGVKLDIEILQAFNKHCMSNYNPEGASTNLNMEIPREDACTQTTSDLEHPPCNQRDIGPRKRVSAMKNSEFESVLFQLRREPSDEKEKTKRLEYDLALVVRERNKEIISLENDIISLETKLAKSDEINASLRTLITSTSQDYIKANTNFDDKRSLADEQPRSSCISDVSKLPTLNNLKPYSVLTSKVLDNGNSNEKKWDEEMVHRNNKKPTNITNSKSLDNQLERYRENQRKAYDQNHLPNLRNRKSTSRHQKRNPLFRSRSSNHPPSSKWREYLKFVRYMTGGLTYGRIKIPAVASTIIRERRF